MVQNINEDFKMNKLEQTTLELLEAGYTIEEVIEQTKQSNIERGTDN